MFACGARSRPPEARCADAVQRLRSGVAESGDRGEQRMFEAQLKDVPFFSGLSKRELATVAQQTDEIDVEPGHALTRQGDSGQEFFVIIDGTAEVLRDEAPIAELGP